MDLRLPDYYCHICESEVASQINPLNQEIECNQCSSNFVELLGQGVENFIIGEAILPCVRPNLADQDSSRRRERRNSEPNRQPLRTRDSIAAARYELTTRDLQQIASGHDGPSMGIFLSSNQNNHIHSHHSPDTRIIPSPYLRSSELGGLMSSFMMVRSGPLLNDFSGNFIATMGGSANERRFEDLLHHLFLNENSHAGEPPATEKILESLKRTVVTNETNLSELGECSISQESFEIGDIAIYLPCNHCYKEESIVHWLKMHNTCPVCRISLSSLADDNNNDTNSAISSHNSESESS